MARGKRLTDEQIETVLACAKNGMTSRKIALTLDIGISTVEMIRSKGSIESYREYIKNAGAKSYEVRKQKNKFFQQLLKVKKEEENEIKWWQIEFHSTEAFAKELCWKIANETSNKVYRLELKDFSTIQPAQNQD